MQVFHLLGLIVARFRGTFVTAQEAIKRLLRACNFHPSCWRCPMSKDFRGIRFDIVAKQFSDAKPLQTQFSGFPRFCIQTAKVPLNF